MPFGEIILVAVALSIDALAASICLASTKRLRLKDMAEIALSFGFFQAFMPCMGWFASSFARNYVENFAHWIAFALLAFIGTKMIFDGVKNREERLQIDKNFGDKKNPQGESVRKNRLRLRLVLALSIATSIDALAVGASLGCLGKDIFVPAYIIGTITFLISLAGTLIGKKIAKFIGGKADILGGTILIVIGVKILLEHFLK